MSETIQIKVDASDGSQFKYAGAGKYSKCVDGEGNIDLEKCEPDPKEHDLEFVLEPAEVAINGKVHKMEFPGEKAISFRDVGGGGSPREDHPFGKPASPGGDRARLRVSNRNHEKKEYKYTLKVNAVDPGGKGAQVRQHDPIITNTGGGLATN